MNNNDWFKSSFSNPTGNCVELRDLGDSPFIEMRDSKHKTGPTLRFTPAELKAFIDGAKAGEFDHLT